MSGPVVPRLRLLSGEASSASVDLKGEVTIGRDWSSTLQLLDARVSRAHAVIEPADFGFVLRDLGSQNGTILNGRRISEEVLRHGDVIRIGDVVLRFEEPESQPPSGSVPAGPALAGDGEDGDRGEPTSPLHVPPPEGGPPPYHGSAVGAVREITGPGRGGEPREEASPSWGTGSRTVFALHGDLDGSFLSGPSPVVGGAGVPDRGKAERDLAALFEVGNLLNTERDPEAILSAICGRITGLFPGSFCAIVELDFQGNPMVRVGRHGEPSQEGRPFPVSATIVREVVGTGCSLLSYDASLDPRFQGSDSVAMHRLRAVMCAPLRSRMRTYGAVFTGSSIRTGVFGPGDLKLLTAIAIEAGIALENARLYGDLERLFLSTIQALASTIDARDGYTGGHSERVSTHSMVLGQLLGLDPGSLRTLRLAGILHDIGKVGVPDAILKCNQHFGDEERERMNVHPVLGAAILRPIPGMEEVALIVRHHHERWDGTGYPAGLAGNDIPLLARIVAVVDAFDAMTSSRPYRVFLPPARALEEIRNQAGTQFDPSVVSVLLEAVARGLVEPANAPPFGQG